MRIATLGTALCWLGSLLIFSPFVGFFFLPVALGGSLLVWFSNLHIQSKLVRGFLPLVPVLAYFAWLFSR